MCLSVSLMNLGNSFMVRDGKTCSCTVRLCVHYCSVQFGRMVIAWAVVFFFLPQVSLGPISGDQVNGLRFCFFVAQA